MTTLGVFPGLAVHDATDLGRTNPEPGRKGAVGGVPGRIQPPYGSHIIGGDLCPVMPLAGGHAALRVGVLRVLCGGSEEQMVRVHAQRVVAVVADKQPLRDGSVPPLPYPAMRSDVGVRPGRESPIASMDRPYPNPAPAGMSGPVDVRPESPLGITTRLPASVALRSVTALRAVLHEIKGGYREGVTATAACLFGMMGTRHLDLLNRSGWRHAEGCLQQRLGFLCSPHFTSKPARGATA